MAKRATASESDANQQHDDVAALREQLAAMTAEASTAKAQLRSERDARRTAELQNMSAQERALVSDQEACDSRIEAMEGEAQSYEDQIAQLADEPGHGKEIAALNRKLASVSAKLETETNRKTFLAGQREKMKAQQKPETEATGNDRVLANGSQLSRYAAKTQAWLEAHPKAFTDARYLSRAILAAQEATTLEGIEDQSPEYFAFIEEKLGERQAPQRTHADSEGDEGEGDELPIPAASEHRTIDRQSYEPEKPQARAAGPGSMAAVPTRIAPSSGNNGGTRRAPALNSEEKEVADALYAHLPAADRYMKYAEGKRYMTQRSRGHFASN